MRIDVVTVFPEMFAAVSGFGVTGRACQKGLAQIQCWDPRDFTTDKHRTVDDRAYGGGPGMVMKAEPLKASLDAVAAEQRQALGQVAPVVYLSPQGERFDQRIAEQLATLPQLTLLAGRYEGIDERLLAASVDRELSVGDYVTSGGELPAMIVIDSVLRLLPDVLGHPQSAEQDSFSDDLLDCPHYTRPELLSEAVLAGAATNVSPAVPAVLCSGDHAAIERWRLKQSLGRTWLRRPDLLAKRVANKPLTAAEEQLLEEFKAEQ